MWNRRIVKGLRRRLRSVRVRITLAATLVTAVAVATAAWAFIHSVETSQLADLRRDADDELDDVAQQLAAGTESVSMPLDSNVVLLGLADAEGAMRHAAPQPNWLRLDEAADDTMPENGSLRLDGDIVPLDEDPGWRIEFLSQDEYNSRFDPHSVHLAERPPSAFDTASTTFADQYEPVYRTVDTPNGKVRLEAMVPIDEVTRSIDAVRSSLLFGLPVVVGLVALATWWLVGRALRPVEAIRAEAEAIGGSTVDHRVPEPPSGDEIGRLARTMNAMLDRLDRSARQQRQFVSDASHELRSPLAGIRADLEVALSEGNRADWPTVATDVLADEARLERLVDDLLLLAADDERKAGGSPSTEAAEGRAAGVATDDRDGSIARGAPSRANLGTVDLGKVVAEETQRTRQVPISATLPDAPVLVTGTGTHLTRLVANLLDNAARHAASRVDVTVTSIEPTEAAATNASEQAPPGSGLVRLTVDDDGPGIPVADRERVFERFVRLNEDRARDQGGAGLGLAVVRSIARRYEGQVRAEGSPLGGARLVIVLAAQNLVERGRVD